MHNETITAAIALAAASSLALAGEGGDVGFNFVGGEVITTLAFDDEGDTINAFPEFGVQERVFVADLNDDSAAGPLGFADEPGFYINSFSGIPGVSELTLSYTQEAPLLVYDELTDSFVETDHRLGQIVIPGIIAVETPLVGNAEGLSFDIGDDIDPVTGGEFDQHPDLQLTSPDDALDAGAYLWQISFSFLDDTGNALFSTESIGVVLVFDAEDLEDAAVDAAERLIPGPGGAAAMITAGAFALRRRR